MTLVDMKCRSCGAALRACDGYMTCDYCGSVYFRLERPIAPEGADSLSLEEFAKLADENLDTYRINAASGTVSCSDDDLVKSKLKAAGRALADGEFFKVKDFLKGVPSDNFAAARLRLLASVNAKSETELAFYPKDPQDLEDYPSLINSCDEENRAVYEKIRGICLSNSALLERIKQGEELIRIENFDEALILAKNLTSQRPFSARARAFLIKASCAAVKDYDPSDDLKRLEACPDAAMTYAVADKDVYGVPLNLDPAVREYCRRFYGRKNAKKESFFKYILKPLLVLIAVGALIGIWKLIEALIS